MRPVLLFCCCSPLLQWRSGGGRGEGVYWGGGSRAHFLLEKQDFLLQFVSFPQGEAVELGHGHPEHLLELLGSQVALQHRQGDGGVFPRHVTLLDASRFLKGYIFLFFFFRIEMFS